MYVLPLAGSPTRVMHTGELVTGGQAGAKEEDIDL